MRGVVVTTNNELYVKEFAPPLYQSIGEVVDGWIEIVRPRGLKHRLVMVVNEEGLLRNLPLNVFGSILYGIHIHGNPIVGNIVFMKEDYTIDGLDFVELTDSDIQEIKVLARNVSGGEIKEIEAR